MKHDKPVEKIFICFEAKSMCMTKQWLSCKEQSQFPNSLHVTQENYDIVEKKYSLYREKHY